MSDSLWHHGLQHARPLCPSPSPGVYPSSCPLHQWHPSTISSSVALFLLLQSTFPSIRDLFPMSQLFTSDDQNIGVSASVSVLPMSIQGWFPLGLTGLISLQSKGLSRLPQHHNLKASILWRSAFFIVPLLHPYMTNGKTIALVRRTFVGKLMSLLFNMLSRLVIAFLPRSRCVLI